VFAFMVTGTRIRPYRMLVVAVVGAAVVLSLSFADSLRTDPTHVGEFWNSLWNGDAWTILARKLRGMVGTFGNWELTLIAVAAVGFLLFALRRPMAWRAAALHTAYDREPGLRPTLVAVLVTAGVGMLVNDSGVAIPAMVLAVAIPLALAAGVRALELGMPGSPARSEPAESASSSMA
jgi:fatty acid desaturase